MRANALHNPAIPSPVLRPIPHMVVGWVMNTAMFSTALVLIVDIKDAIRAD